MDFDYFTLEVQNTIHIDTQWPEWLHIVNLSLKEQSEAGVWQTAGGLHAGEAEALVLSKQKNADWFLTDDAATRLFVSMLGIEVHGSLGVVLWNAAKRHINRKETEEALDRLHQSSLWVSENIYREARQALDCIFRPIPDSDSDPFRTPIPNDSGHQFRSFRTPITEHMSD